MPARIAWMCGWVNGWMSGCEDGGTRSAMLRASFFDLTGIAVLGIVRRMALVLRIYYGRGCL